jgi:hypothetical protein
MVLLMGMGLAEHTEPYVTLPLHARGRGLYGFMIRMQGRAG